MMKRRFIPVGQGAFYLEQFEKNSRKVNVVYDCGSSTPGFDIEQEIRNRFTQGEDISIVFISHLHRDHVNGLEYLLYYCNVKNIIFPLTYPEDKILMDIDCLCASTDGSLHDPYYQLVGNPAGFIHERSRDTAVYAVNYGDEDSNNLNYFRSDEIDSDYILRSGRNVLDRIRDENSEEIFRNWEYIPFNFRNNTRKDLFYKVLSAKLGDTIDDKNITQYLFQWDDKRIQKGIIKAYEKVNKDLNLNTMTLFSGTKDESVRQCIRLSLNCFFPCKHFLCQNKENGCLYLGDYNAKGKTRWNDLRQKYNEYWKYIGCVQIPHHGSSHSYNHELALIDAFHIISAGKSNCYRHPHSCVLKDFLYEHKYPYIVTEDKSTEVILKIDI